MKFLSVLYVFSVMLITHFSTNVVAEAKELHLFKILQYLDVNTLSRLIAFKQFATGEKHELQPKFYEGWQYAHRNVARWTRRLGMYGYGIAGLEAHGDGNCFFYSVWQIFRLNNVTNDDLLRLLNPNLPESAKIAIRGILEDEEPVTPLNLKRISNIISFGGDPFDEESMKTFDSTMIKEKIRGFAEMQGRPPVDENERFEFGPTMFGKKDMTGFARRFDSGEDELTILKEVYMRMEEVIEDRWGDYLDIENLEYAFYFSFVMFNTVDTRIFRAPVKFDVTPKFIVTLLYHNYCHYDVAGIFKLGAKDAKEIKTIFKISEIPMPLLLIMADDCQHMIK